MCLLERQDAPTSLDMTLAARLYPQNSCFEVGVPMGGWSELKCPNCRHEVRVSLASCGKHASNGPPSPTHPMCTPLPLCSTPSSPLLASPYSDELRRLADTVRALRLSGWYYGNLDWQGARNILKDASVGAFLIRDSGDRNFIFSLSLQTEKGPTSVRLHFEQGFFRLDCDKPLARYMPRFRGVMELVAHYARGAPGAGAGGAGAGAGAGARALPGTMWVDREGCPHSPVLLRAPLRRAPPSLLHAARLAIHRALDSNPLTPKLWCAPKHRLLALPPPLIDYLGEYPYSI